MKLTLEDRRTHYRQAVLERVTQAIAAATKGSRNDTLNTAAFGLGQLAGGGVIDRHVAEQTLLEAVQPLLSRDFDYKQATYVVKRSLDQGASQPRDWPDDLRSNLDTPPGKKATANDLPPALASVPESQPLCRPPRPEVLDLWDTCLRVTDPRCDPRAAQWLRSRSLDPERVGKQDLARVLPAGRALPSWAGSGRQDWRRSGHLLLVSARSSAGELQSVHARCVLPGNQTCKSVWPAAGPGSVTGLAFANEPGRRLLAGADGAVEPLAVVVCEGAPDFLTWSMLRPDLAVLGITAGSWTSDFARRIPRGSRIALWTHLDGAGDKYAKAISKTFLGLGVELRRWTGPRAAEPSDSAASAPSEATPGEQSAKAHDANDLYRLGKLPRNPFADTVVLVQPGTPLENDPKARKGHLVADCFGNAPQIPGNLIVPEGWRIDADGVYSVTAGRSGQAEEKKICYAPILITRRLEELEDGAKAVVLLWLWGHDWHEERVVRDVIARDRELQKLAAFGAPVTSNSARSVVNWLAAFEAVNHDKLEVEVVSRHLGWIERGGTVRGFLAGPEVWIAAPGVTDQVRFWPTSDGERQLVQGYRKAGSYEGWARAAELVGAYPKAELALFSSFLPPLLAIIDAHSFVIDWCYRTSQGKTTVMLLSGSIWGDSARNSPSCVMKSWNSTKVWMETAQSVLNGLPLLLDDSKDRITDESVAEVIYQVANGRGRGRGAPLGLRAQAIWRTVLLSNGEEPVVSFTQDGGTRARVVTVWGQPFDGADETTARVVLDIAQQVAENFGWAGPMWVKYLLDHQADWPAWKERFRQRRAELSVSVANDSLKTRLAEYLAALSVTAELVQDAIPFPFSEPDLVGRIWPAVMHEADQADRVREAMNMTISWARSHVDDFWGPTSRKHPPNIGWAGSWKKGYIAFLPDVLERVLKEFGHSPDSILRCWKEREWLLCSPNRWD